MFGFHRLVVEVFALLGYFRGLGWQLVTYVYGQYIGTFFKSEWNDTTVRNCQPTRCSIAAVRSLFQSFVWRLMLLHRALELPVSCSVLEASHLLFPFRRVRKFA